MDKINNGELLNLGGGGGGGDLKAFVSMSEW